MALSWQENNKKILLCGPFMILVVSLCTIFRRLAVVQVDVFVGPCDSFTYTFQTGFTITAHYNDVIMGAITSQITSLTSVFSIVYSDADQRKHESSASLGTGEFPAQMVSYAENVSIWWRHHGHFIIHAYFTAIEAIVLPQ